MDTFLELLNKPPVDRNALWEKTFLEELPKQKVKLLSDRPQQGPDNYSYLFVQLTNENVEQAETMSDILSWSAKKGVGLAINPEKTYPDYVLSYGQVWNYLQNKKFIDFDRVQGQATFDENRKVKIEDVQVGEPSEHYFPVYARKIVKEFLSQFDILQPKVMLLKLAEGQEELCFSLESLGAPSEEDQKILLESLSWFFPSHYSLTCMSEAEFPQFKTLGC